MCWLTDWITWKSVQCEYLSWICWRFSTAVVVYLLPWCRHVPRIFARRQVLNDPESRRQKKRSVIIVPFKPGTDLFHYKIQNKPVIYNFNRKKKTRKKSLAPTTESIINTLSSWWSYTICDYGRDGRYTVVFKSLSPVNFLCKFWLLFYLHLIFSLHIIFFHYSPNSTCAKMEHALHYQLELWMFTFFFQRCFNSARHGVYRFFQDFCFYIFPAIINHIS